ncbi:uncharacterized protein [Lolium perenne]|jgi:hypothetical protein|uniref:uncharacterized protein n=1 Tax=Lolium perenne TaxID=4522 RepID=UPI0021EB0E81|nr:uncharacterized protein LOC127307392 [Lolium perenne]
MGNCLYTGDGGGSEGGGYLSGGDGQGRTKVTEEVAPSSVLKVKMVLTKTELEWLMAQLKGGDRRLEDVLREMARKRDARGWRPSLESIDECGSDSETAAICFD